jgi:hypothetical protein
MTERMKIFSLAVATLLVMMACSVVPGLGRIVRGSGTIENETYLVSGFDQVSICCGMQLFLTQGTEEYLEIEADDNLLPEIEATVTDGELTIRYEGQFGAQYRPSRPVQVRVGIMEVRGLNVSGGGRVETSSIETDDLVVNLSGGSRAVISVLTADEIQVNISGGGRATINGSVMEQNVNLSGGSNYHAEDLESQEAWMGLSGGSRSVIWVSEALEANLSGGSRLEVYGDPTISERSSGGSQLIRLGEK